jgi:hypothetical protein
VLIKAETTPKIIIVSIGFISKLLISKKSKLAPLKYELSTKKPVINILSRNVIPTVIKEPIRK